MGAMAIPSLPSVDGMVARIDSLLDRARAWKASPSIEPPLPVLEFSGDKGLPFQDSKSSTQLHNSQIDAASRRIFHRIAV